VASNG